MNMHLRQSPWVHTHTTRSRALTTRECSHSHESPSYKVHNHPYTSRYRYTYIMHNAITQSKKVSQTLPTFQGYGPARYKKRKTEIAMPMELAQARCRKVKGGTWMGTLIYALEKRLKERERENRFGKARPPNLLIIALCGLASFYLHPCPFFLFLGSRTLPSSILTLCVYI